MSISLNTLSDNDSGSECLDKLHENDVLLGNALDSATLSCTEWLPNAYTPTYASTTTFTLEGDHTSLYVAYRRIKATLTSGAVYSHVVSSSYSSFTDLTTVTISDAVLDDTLSAVNLGILTPDGAIPVGKVTLTELSSDPTPGTNKGLLYVKDVDGKTEFFFVSDNRVVQITDGGILPVDPLRLTEQGSNPTPGTDQGILFTKDKNGKTELYFISDNGLVPITFNGNLAVAPPAMIQLTGWQTDPAAYSAESQDAYNTDGHGKDLLSHLVFIASVFTVIYAQVAIPFDGYDLRICFPYRMSTAFSGDVDWNCRWAAISEDEAISEIDAFATFTGIKDSGDTLIHTASSSANTYKMIDTDDFKIPASDYSAGDMLVFQFYRYGSAAEDTHTGNAEVPKNGFYLKPVIPSS